MTRILFLDDDEWRHEAFARRNVGRDVTHVRTAAEAIEALGAGRFDEVHLDHDLGLVPMTPEQFAALDPVLPSLGLGSGYDVAEHIASMHPGRHPTVATVHSWNPAGAERMCRVLSATRTMRVVRRPFEP